MALSTRFDASMYYVYCYVPAVGPPAFRARRTSACWRARRARLGLVVARQYWLEDIHDLCLRHPRELAALLEKRAPNQHTVGAGVLREAQLVE